MALVQKALTDPNAEAVRAALESSVTLAASQPYAVAELLGRTVTTTRPLCDGTWSKPWPASARIGRRP